MAPPIVTLPSSSDYEAECQYPAFYHSKSISLLIAFTTATDDDQKLEAKRKSDKHLDRIDEVLDADDLENGMEVDEEEEPKKAKSNSDYSYEVSDDDDDDVVYLYRRTGTAGQVTYHVCYDTGEVKKVCSIPLIFHLPFGTNANVTQVGARDIYKFVSRKRVAIYEHESYECGENMETHYSHTLHMGVSTGGTSKALLARYKKEAQKAMVNASKKVKVIVSDPESDYEEVDVAMNPESESDYKEEAKVVASDQETDCEEDTESSLSTTSEDEDETNNHQKRNGRVFKANLDPDLKDRYRHLTFEHLTFEHLDSDNTNESGEAKDWVSRRMASILLDKRC